MSNKLFFVFVFTITLSIFSQKIKSPSEFLGYPLGSQFTRHHEVINYFNYLANNSNNVTLENYGKTNERRTLQVAYISSKDNLTNIETIRKKHLSNANIEKTTSLKDKAIVWFSYNVHGNEASSTEASMLTAYQLITNKKAWLDNLIVIIDPCLNPDGRDRYVNWYHQVVHKNTNSNSLSREHKEPWVNGRPNHYLFDLNRDWAWATQIESQQRLKIYNKWLPHIHVDFHEQSHNMPYYFAPAAEPFHEIITPFQKSFQEELGKNHATYFDKNGWLFFTKERFDLLYPSYGDTYPTFNGAIGMTYEQAGGGKAGLSIKTNEGELLTLKDRLTHHTTTGLSTIEVASKNIERLNSEFKKYFNNTDFKFKSYILQGDIDKLHALKKLLDRHEISYAKTSEKKVSGFIYRKNAKGSLDIKENNITISTKQPKGKLVEVLFEPKATVKDSLTYDITAWSLPYAYGLQTVATKKEVTTTNYNLKTNEPTLKNDVFAYAFDWNHVTDARLLSDFLKHKIRVRTNEKYMENSNQKLASGSLIITKRDNKHISNFDELIYTICKKHHKVNKHITTGLSTKGVDIGSLSVKEIKDKKIAILGGNQISTLNFGEIQFFLENDLAYNYSVVLKENFSFALLSKFNTLILPNGNYAKIFDEKKLQELKKWVQQGGKLIAIGQANQVFGKSKIFNLSIKKTKKNIENKTISTPKKNIYANKEREQIKKLITGAIFKTNVDNTHPLAYGYSKDYFTLKLKADAYHFLTKGTNVVTLENNTVISGFAGSEALKKQENSLIFGTEKIGQGNVVYLIDNPVFRGFWNNGKLFFVNALFR